MSAPPSIHRKRRWPLFLGAIVLILVALYFTVTSGAFLKAVVLPQVAAALKSDLTVGDLSVSPFSSVTLTDLKLTPKGGETLATVKQVHARYSLRAILGGTILVEEATVDGAEINLVEAVDGTSNLSRLLDGLSKDSKPSKGPPPKLAIHNVAVKNGIVRRRHANATGPAEVIEVSNLNVSLDQLVNGQPGKVTIAADARAQNIGAPPGTAAGRIAGSFEVVLSEALLPQVLKGTLKIDLTEGAGPFQAFAGLGAVVDVDLTGTAIRDFALRFSQKGQELGRISLQGPFDLAKQEAMVAYEVSGLDRRVLSLAGVSLGLDFGATTVGATGRVDIISGGNERASNGRLTVNQFSLGGAGGRTPTLDISADYRLSVKPNDKTALVDKFDLHVKQGAKELVRGGLDRAMNLSWDKAASGFSTSTYSVVLAGLDLSQWRSVLPSNAPNAVVSSEMRVTSEKDGRLLRIGITNTVEKLNVKMAGAEIDGASVLMTLVGTCTDFTVLNAESFAVELRRGRDELATVSGSADWHRKNEVGGAQLQVTGQVPALLGLYPVPGVQLRSGAIKVSSQIAKRATDLTASVSLNLSDLTGTVGQAQLNQYQGTLDASIVKNGDDLDISRANLTAQTGYATGGGVDLNGKYNLVKQTGTFSFKAVNLNESALGPFVAPALLPNKLLSVALDLKGAADVNLKGRSGLQLDLKVSNLRAEDPGHRLPATPMALGLLLDASQQGLATELRKFSLDLGATDRAKNILTFAGSIDMGATNPAPGKLSLQSDGLDLTRYYDLFTGTSSNATAAATPAPKPASGPEVEPAAMHLPLRDFTLDIDVARVYLRELDLAALKGRVLLKDDHVTVDPFGFTLNGAPVTAKVAANLGVAGYQYDINFGAERVPLTPLINSFVSDLKGLAQGEMLAKLNLKGAGVTGVSLKKNLAGLILVQATNAQIKIPEKPVRLPGFLSALPIFPNEINPGTVLSLIGKKAVLAEPIRTVQTRVDIASGVARVTETRVSNSALLVEVNGDLKMADIFTNSLLNLPVQVAFAEGGKMPAVRGIGREVGTVGVPTFEKDLLGLAQVAGGLLSGFGVPGGDKAAGAVKAGLDQLNLKSGGALNAAGDLLKATTSTNNAAGGTANPIGGILNSVLGAATNKPAANTNKTVNPLDLLNFGRKK